MNATYLPGTARRGDGSAILRLGGVAWLLLPASVDAAGFDAAAFADEPAAHAAYDRMIEAMPSDERDGQERREEANADRS